MSDSARPGRATARPRSPLVAKSVPPLALLSVLVAVWALIAARSGLPGFILPSPADVVRAGWDTPRLLLPALGATLFETGLGLPLSIVLAAAIAPPIHLSSFLRRAFYPLPGASPA